jgi:hypothetical protein
MSLPTAYRCVMAALLSLNCALAMAGSTTGTVVKYFTFDWPGVPPLLFVFISSSSSNPAPCGATTSSSNRWVTRTDTAAGKANMAVIMLAKAMGNPITISGKGGLIANPCEDWGDTESIHAVFTAD